MMPGLGGKYDIEIETTSKPVAEYQTDEYFELNLPVAPAVMVADEILVEGSNISQDKVEAAICRHLGISEPEPKKKGYFNMQQPETIKTKPSLWKPLLFIIMLGAVIFFIRYYNLDRYLEKEHLRQLIAGYGIWGPIIYLFIWTIAPPLFLPGLPLTLVGGVLFGFIPGVIYTIIGATSGATLAFLTARYLARDWVASKLAGTKAAALDEKVEQHGWKIVAFTRLIPVFPYNLLNYAFGLTGISLAVYVITTFIFMLPMTTAYIFFSANIIDLFRGKISREVIAGVILIVLVTLIPVIYKKITAKRGGKMDL
ncbi:MAG: hypothetical protein QG578_1548 [Thermodesulfobacteriota bacterium]|nr:hypothetical protein [Thermodesulfobacteriota bacterium]